MDNVERRFLYHAHALAVGGHLTRPCCEVIDAQAAVALPVVGGNCTARIENYSHRDIISFRSATSIVTGNEAKGPDGAVYNSLATLTIEGLNIANVVTADKVVARLTCEQSKPDNDLPICPVGSYFVNLRVANIPVDLRAREELCRPVGFAEITAIKKLQTPSGHAMMSLFGPASEDMRGFAAAGLETKDACRIRVPGFGTVYVGEYLLTQGSRRLTMLRVKMGSPIQGELIIGEVGGNGHVYP